jgi:predicted Fe-S protein YdhL (DUF1289 family)
LRGGLAMDDIWKRDTVESPAESVPESPCVKLCVIQPESRLCLGCYRSIDEITAWSRLGIAARRAVMAELPSRAAGLVKRRGGRAGRIAP